MVACPACKGTKVGCVTGRFPCPCCKGKGKITEERDRVLALIRVDLSAALKKLDEQEEQRIEAAVAEFQRKRKEKKS